MRFESRLQIVLKNNVAKSNAMLPPMLIQPLIENAINHGIRNSGRKGIIHVDLIQENDLLSVIVEDNGVGRAAAQENRNHAHKGMGLSIIRRRLDLLNDKYHTKVHELIYTDLFENGNPSGTKVVMNLLVTTKETD